MKVEKQELGIKAMKQALLLLLYILAILPECRALNFEERQAIKPNLGGFSVDFRQGNTLVVGSPKENAAYVYKLSKDDGPDNLLSWTKAASLQTLSSSSSASFGSSVTLSCLELDEVDTDSSCYIVVADQMVNGGKGAVYVFESLSTYVTIEPDSSQNVVNFGCALGIQHLSSSTAELFVGSHSSAVYRYLRTNAVPTWQLGSTLTPADSGSGGSLFGFSLALHENRLAVGAPGGAGSSGYAYLYSRGSSEQQLTFEARLAPPSYEQQVGLRFGSSVDLSGEEDRRLAVGVCRTGNAANSDGQAYIFYKSPLTGALAQEAKLVPPPSSMFSDQDVNERAHFGCSVAVSKVSGSRIVVVGAPSDAAATTGGRSGATYSYSLPYELFGWGLRQRQPPSGSVGAGTASVGNCGLSIALSATGQELIVGCPTHSSLDATASMSLQAEIISFVDVTVTSTNAPALIRCNVSLLTIFSSLVAAMLLSLCGSLYVRERRERLSSYMRLTAHRGEVLDAESEGIALLGTTTDTAYASEDGVSHRRVSEGASSDNGGSARTDGRSEVAEAYNGRVLDFRLRDYVLDFLLCSAGGVGGYLHLYVLYANRASVAFSLLAAANALVVLTPVLILYLSLYHPRRLPVWMSMHLRLSLHLQVHHSGADGLAACTGEFSRMMCLIFVASVAFSAPELLKYLPWRLTNFCMASKGYPTYPTFKWLHACSIAVSISYVLSQTLLLCPLGDLAIYGDDGKKVTQSMARPSTPELATYLHSSLGDELSENMFSTAGIFGIILLGTLGLKLSRAVVKHRQLVAHGRGMCRTCILGVFGCIQCLYWCGRDVPTGQVRHSSREGGGMVPVGHSFGARRYKFALEDDDDFIDDSGGLAEKDYVSNQLRDITVTFGEEQEERGQRLHEGEEEDGGGEEELQVRVPTRRGIRLPDELSPSARRTIEIEKAMKRARGKLLVLPV